MNFEHIHPHFPIKQQRVYLNNASIGAMSTRVIGAVDAFMADVRDNGRINYPNWCRIADEEHKARLAQLIGAQADEIAYIKNTTEGILLVANGLDWREGDNVVIAEREYASNVYCWMNLARRGVNINWIRSADGRITPEMVADAIDERTRLVSISAVQFWNGFRIDLARIGEICRRRGVLLNLDAIQWIGALDLDVSQYAIDFLSVGGHKWMLAPIGTGFFYCRRESMELLHPHNVGYHSVDNSDEGHLEYALRFRPNAGRFEEALVNFPGIWGMNAAVEQLLELGMGNVEQHILGLTKLAAEGLRQRGYEIVSPMGVGERSGVLAFRHEQIAAETIEQRLSDANIHVAIRAGNLRISPSFYNDQAEIEQFLSTLPRLC
ncbi:MAG: aminotransferase class V-fold PLP-dependent enzyme [Chloroflexota bacterium]